MTLQEFRELQRILKNIGKVSSIQQLMQIQKKYPIVRKYLPNKTISNNDLDSWTHIVSNQYDRFDGKEETIEHRLYINNDKKYTHRIAALFTEKCRQRNIPFYYKYNEGKDRDDTIVIYSDIEHLTDYISILKEMKKENPQLMSNIHEPPMLTGRIDGWIGYGADPKGKTSYTFKRTNSMFKALECSIVEWVNNKEKVDISSNNNKRLVERKDIFARYITNYLIEENKGKIDSRMINQLYTEIYNNMNNIIDCFKNRNQLYYLKANNIKINYQMIKKMFRLFSKTLVENDPDYVNFVRDNISKQLSQEGIDPSMICFDEDAKRELEMCLQDKRSEQLRSMMSSTATLGETKKLYTA